MSRSALRFASLSRGAAAAIQLAAISLLCAAEPTRVASLPTNAPHASSLSQEIRNTADRVSHG